MKSRTLLSALIVFLALLAPGCRQRHAGVSEPVTQTVAPAAAQPAPTGTDAMTQTVDVEDGRSEEDGGVTTEHPAGTSPKAAAPQAKKPPAKKR